jgi:alpha-glucosidase
VTSESRPVAAWWQRGVLYQVYPRSFRDADGDGVGDLRGVQEKLDYLVELGVDALWLSPIFPSPMVDFGYDVADYVDVDPRFGTLADFDALLAAAHARGLAVLLDFVPNHSSDRHPWFVESRASRQSAKRDWYLWRDPAPGGGPPNNWISDFGGSAWTWDEPSGQFYYHAFLPQQPDLNWRNPEVRAAMFAVLRFWLDRGVDGFRVDVLWHLIKAEGFPDNPPNPAYRPGMGEMHRVLQTRSTDQPEVHAIAAEMRRIADSYGARVVIGEIYLPVERLVAYYGRGGDGVHLPFNFQLIDAPWRARELAARIADYEAALPPGAWPNWVLGNHDRPRVAARLGAAQARVAAMLLLTLRGTPTMYYGDELGIGLVEVPPAQVQDPLELREPGIGRGRDPVRTPMAWDSTTNAGFTTGTPWLPLHADWRSRNVECLAQTPGSSLVLYRALLALRRAHPALAIGELALFTPSTLDTPACAARETDDDVLVYERRCDGDRLLVVLNLGHAPRSLAAPTWARGARAVLSTLEDGPLSTFPPLGERLALRPDEGLIFAASASPAIPHPSTR